MLGLGGWAVSTHRTMGEIQAQLERLRDRQDTIVDRGTTRIDQLVNKMDVVIYDQSMLRNDIEVITERLSHVMKPLAPPPPER
jgi:hypothetical protein